MSKTIICSICGNEIPEGECTTFHGQTLCPGCLHTHTVVCRYCGQRVWDEDIHYDEGQPICPSCFAEHFLTCEGCGGTIHEHEARYLDDDEDAPYCSSCYEELEDRVAIHDYSYKPEPIFWGQGPRYFGVELESPPPKQKNCWRSSTGTAAWPTVSTTVPSTTGWSL